MAFALSPVHAAILAITRYFSSTTFSELLQDVKAELSAAEDSQSGKAERKAADRSSIRVVRRGVWTLWEYAPPWTDSIPGFAIWSDLVGFWESIPYIVTLTKDLWALSPLYVSLYILADMLRAIAPTLKLAQSQRFLLMIEDIVTTKQVDESALAWGAFLQFSFSTLEWTSYQLEQSCSPILQQHLQYMFNRQIMALRLNLDLAALQEKDFKAKMEEAGSTHYGGQAWEGFKKLVKLVATIFELGTVVAFVWNTMVQQEGGRLLVLLCLGEIMLSTSQRQEWNSTFWAKVTSIPYVRSETLFSFAEDEGPMKELIGNGTTDFVQQEYDDAVKALHNVNTQAHPYWDTTPWKISSLFGGIFPDLTLLALGLKIAANPATMKISSVTVLQYTTSTLSSSIIHLQDRGSNLMKAFAGIKALYELKDIRGGMIDGTETFPPTEYASDKGLKIEFRNVSFTYPGLDKPAINDLSFTIPAGALCVIVGENGCGKSTTIKLINRLYDVGEGEILLDDGLIKDYKVKDVRKACAVMHQDYQHFKSLTLAENIAFGNVDQFRDEEAIKEAARLGGAYDFISDLPKGFNQVARYSTRFYWSRGTIPKGSKLEKLEKDEKSPNHEFSGGQTQRLALSRAFMRSSTSDSVKLLAYDEPSAALDPKAEYDLFERLRNRRAGKTMVFVTHRFGYLTKHADLIIYMEGGRAVEKGSHEELLQLKGKYANLYQVQAQAFQS